MRESIEYIRGLPKGDESNYLKNLNELADIAETVLNHWKKYEGKLF
jgi:hypothetical protein